MNLATMLDFCLWWDQFVEPGPETCLAGHLAIGEPCQVAMVAPNRQPLQNPLEYPRVTAKSERPGDVSLFDKRWAAMNFEYHLMFDVASAKYQQSLRGDIKNIHQQRSGSRVTVNIQTCLLEFMGCSDLKNIRISWDGSFWPTSFFASTKKVTKKSSSAFCTERWFQAQIHERHVLFSSHVSRCPCVPEQNLWHGSYATLSLMLMLDSLTTP